MSSKPYVFQYVFGLSTFPVVLHSRIRAPGMPEAGQVSRHGKNGKSKKKQKNGKHTVLKTRMEQVLYFLMFYYLFSIHVFKALCFSILFSFFKFSAFSTVGSALRLPHKSKVAKSIAKALSLIPK